MEGKIIPLFGPNIRKMKENRDIDGLINALTSDNLDVRVEASEAIKDVGDPRAIGVLNKALIDALRYGDVNEQIEAIALIQGRAPDLLTFVLPGESKKILNTLKKIQKKLPLEDFKDALHGVVEQRKSAIGVWYALIALVELGDRCDEVLNTLIEFTNEWIKSIDNTMQGIQGLLGWGLGRSAIGETLRALSYFKGNSIAITAITKAYEGEIFSSSRISLDKDNAICALVALGDSSTREYLEYLVSHKRAPKVALELYGTATYDEIKDKIVKK